MTSNTQGVEFLRNPSVNKATAYSETEKQSLGLIGLVPDATETINTPACAAGRFIPQGSRHGYKTAGGHRESPARFGNRARMGSLHEVVGASSNAGTHKEIDGS